MAGQAGWFGPMGPAVLLLLFVVVGSVCCLGRLASRHLILVNSNNNLRWAKFRGHLFAFPSCLSLFSIPLGASGGGGGTPNSYKRGSRLYLAGKYDGHKQSKWIHKRLQWNLPSR